MFWSFFRSFIYTLPSPLFGFVFDQPDYDDEIERKSKPFFSRSSSKTSDKNRKKYGELIRREIIDWVAHYAGVVSIRPSGRVAPNVMNEYEILPHLICIVWVMWAYVGQAKG